MATLQPLVAYVTGLPVSVQASILLLIALGIYFVVSSLNVQRPLQGFPIASLPDQGLSPLDSFVYKAPETIARGIAEFDAPFQVISYTGPKIVLPNRFAEELKNDLRVDFAQSLSKDFLTHYPGFEWARHTEINNRILPDLLKSKLTPRLASLTTDIVKEANGAISDTFGATADRDGWTSVPIKEKCVGLVARISSRIFLGPALCRNPAWLKTTSDLLVTAVAASNELRSTPAIVRPFVYWFLPQCKALRRCLRDASDMIMGEVARRRAETTHDKPERDADLIEWIYEVSKQKDDREKSYGCVYSQITLTFAGTHTTSEATSRALLDICAHPQIVQPLRTEIIQQLREHGWTRKALYSMRLLDSFLKESQRVTPPTPVSMRRLVLKPLILSDGTVLPVDTRIMVAQVHEDPLVYESPEKFDINRFLHKREIPGNEHKYQHMSVSSSHMVFGYGMHSCPGRFFASDEIKVILCLLLLQYEIRSPDTGKPQAIREQMETGIRVPRGYHVQYRKLDLTSEESDILGAVANLAH